MAQQAKLKKRNKQNALILCGIYDIIALNIKAQNKNLFKNILPSPFYGTALMIE
mgnify:CR=1 FL=1